MQTETARELARRANKLKSAITASMTGFCYVSLELEDDALPFEVVAKGECSSFESAKPVLPTFSFRQRFASFEEGLTAAEAAWEAHLAAHDVTVRRKMALAIIDLVDGEGSVTDRSLRLAGFTQAQIDAQHEAASELANEMASKGPFSVVLTGAGNHEEAA